jgi:hypothetical protein
MLAMIPVALIIFIASVIFAPIVNILNSLLEFIIAKLLGGKANFGVHLNASILPGLAQWVFILPILIINIPITWLTYVPIISCIAPILQIPIVILLLIATIYAIYLKVIAFKEVHKFSTIRAVIAVLLPILIVILLAMTFTILLMLSAAVSSDLLMHKVGLN